MQVCHSLSLVNLSHKTTRAHLRVICPTPVEFFDVQWQRKEWEREMQYQIFTRQIKRKSVKALMWVKG